MELHRIGECGYPYDTSRDCHHLPNLLDALNMAETDARVNEGTNRAGRDLKLDQQRKFPGVGDCSGAGARGGGRRVVLIAEPLVEPVHLKRQSQRKVNLECGSNYIAMRVGGVRGGISLKGVKGVRDRNAPFHSE